eukprot:CAMPEP_0201479168 /NCGR_PEP_ID=MMETSP0151_2-20130828/3882_1 /ASSEMBLY_ACC=CAM_ASM_000257 /TAXON_ID=200890 /ORGANISM="Paramoeba atlantica, Strain 621/1 / CCAP 1560/9" /LENGTH=621 /DNA_ID=CAMNT_0047860527 /DNA_START=1037 /DNA_END=2899 /DNA_ORIENTATION=-
MTDTTLNSFFDSVTPVGECLYRVGVEVTVDLYSSVVVLNRTLDLTRTVHPVPVIAFSPQSSCGLFAQGDHFYVEIEPIELPDGYFVSDYIWEASEGSPEFPDCDDDDPNVNCGGNGFPFFSIPQSSFPACVSPYQLEVKVVVGIEGGDSDISGSTSQSCEVQVLQAPSGGTCFLISDEPVPALDDAVVGCSDWVVECGLAFPLSATPFKFSTAGEGALVQVDLVKPVEETHSFTVGSDLEVVVEVCNSASCTLSNVIPIEVGELDTDDIEDTLDDAEECLEIGDLDCVLDEHGGLTDGFPDCDDQSDELQELMQELLDQTIALFEAYVATESPPDPTPLLEIWSILAEKSCVSFLPLFEALEKLCHLASQGEVASNALNNLFDMALNSISDTETDSTELIDLFDQAISINECLQVADAPENCGIRDGVAYTGSKFSYFQLVVPMEEFRTSSVSVTVPHEGPPETRFIFPEGFDEQILASYKAITGEDGTFYCVVLNLISSNALSDSGDVDNLGSGVSGLTFRILGDEYSGEEIPLGDNGAPPLEDVIVQIFETVPDGECESGNRFADDSDDPIYTCSYYVGDGEFDASGCTFQEATDEYVSCECIHFSNFGLLFACDSGGW